MPHQVAPLPSVGKHKTLSTAKRAGRATDAGSFLRIDDVIASTGLSRATIYRLLAAGDFPAKIALTIRCVGWWEADVTAWLESRLGRPSSEPGEGQAA
ncbi:helix-turn-helix transcriptional regulator [Sphingomonas hylomeconis]|nr:AlpA family phage regulatory protein [Sphingomonas hylomeconis]